jgi:hypothetical protein
MLIADDAQDRCGRPSGGTVEVTGKGRAAWKRKSPAFRATEGLVDRLLGTGSSERGAERDKDVADARLRSPAARASSGTPVRHARGWPASTGRECQAGQRR